jgi:hypothetical protein
MEDEEDHQLQQNKTWNLGRKGMVLDPKNFGSSFPTLQLEANRTTQQIAFRHGPQSKHVVGGSFLPGQRLRYKVIFPFKRVIQSLALLSIQSLSMVYAVAR